MNKITNIFANFEKKSCVCCCLCTLGPAYNEFSYSEHPAITSRFLCISIIDCNVNKFVYNEHPLITSSFFCIILLVSGSVYIQPTNLPPLILHYDNTNFVGRFNNIFLFSVGSFSMYLRKGQATDQTSYPWKITRQVELGSQATKEHP